MVVNVRVIVAVHPVSIHIYRSFIVSFSLSVELTLICRRCIKLHYGQRKDARWILLAEGCIDYAPLPTIRDLKPRSIYSTSKI